MQFNTGRIVVAALSAVFWGVTPAAAQVSLTTLGTAYTQNFDTLANTGTSSSVPTGWAFSDAGLGGSPNLYSTGTGSSATGDVYSFGAAASTDRAFGSLASGTTTANMIGASFTNNTGSTITSLDISFFTEEWRRGDTAADVLAFSYSTSATALTTGTYTAFATLNANSIVGCTGSGNGNSTSGPPCRAQVSGSITGLSIAPGATFWIRWQDSNSSGNDDGLAIDDFSLTPQGASQGTTLSINDVSHNEGNSGSTTYTFTVSLSAPAGTGGVTFDIATADQTATIADNDYTAKSLTGQSIPQGSSSYTFDVLVNGDTNVESNETFLVNVTNVTGATIADGQGVGTIVNDDAAPITLSINDVSHNEGNSGTTTFSFIVSLSAVAGPGGVTFDIATQDGTATIADNDYTPKSLTAQTISQGNSSYTFDVLVNGDTNSESNETFAVNVTNVTGATIADSQGIGTIVDDDTTTAPTSVKISQVYGGGGNSGSTYKNDFIELFNQSTAPVNITGWSVQQTSATGPLSPATTWSVTPLCLSGTCTILPGRYFLVWEGPGAGGTTDLPAPDVTGSLALGAGSGKVALVNNTTPLSGACPSSVSIADLVGYGSTATCSETSPAPAPGNTTGVLRKYNGCTDTNNNASDFAEVAPLPRNSSATVQTCPVAGQLSGVGTATPAGVDPGGNTLLKVAVTPGATSTGITVTANLTSIGGSASQQFFDDGTNGDATSGDNTFSFRIDVPVLATGAYYIPVTVTDQQGGSASAPITITVQSPTCGVERWSIKVGTDSDANLVNTGSPIRTTVQALRSLGTPGNLPLDHRIQPTEINTYELNGLLTVYKLEDDVDYHIVLQDPQGRTMVTEIPSPACDGSTSPFDAGIKLARQKFDARLTGISSFQTANLPVYIKGVGFFDFIHGQTGVAPNGIEIHPIIDINFTAQSGTTLQSTANPSVYNQNITLTATVTVPSITPTGTVTFFDTTTSIVLGTALLDGAGHASIQTSGLTAGSHTITASYEGDFNSSESSGTLVQNVSPAAPVLTWNHPADILYGSALSSTQLNASANVPGSFAYNPPAGTVLNVGNNQPLNATFTPTSTNYTSGTVGTTINVLPVQQPSGPAVSVTRLLSRDGSNNVVVQLTLTNTGGTVANNVMLTTLKVGMVNAPGLPIAVGNIAAGTSAVVTVNMGAPIGASGAASSLTASGTFTGGTFTSNARITLP